MSISACKCIRARRDDVGARSALDIVALYFTLLARDAAKINNRIPAGFLFSQNLNVEIDPNMQHRRRLHLIPHHVLPDQEDMHEPHLTRHSGCLVDVDDVAEPLVLVLGGVDGLHIQTEKHLDLEPQPGAKRKGGLPHVHTSKLHAASKLPR